MDGSTECAAERGFTFPAYAPESDSFTLNPICYDSFSLHHKTIRPFTPEIISIIGCETRKPKCSSQILRPPHVKAHATTALKCYGNLEKQRLIVSAVIFIYARLSIKNHIVYTVLFGSTLLASTSSLVLTPTLYQEPTNFVYNSAHDSRKRIPCPVTAQIKKICCDSLTLS